jgi:hypothetical protein
VLLLLQDRPLMWEAHIQDVDASTKEAQKRCELSLDVCVVCGVPQRAHG